MPVEENVSLAAFTTLRLGGAARYFARVTTEPELLEALAFADAHALPIFILGGGSNLVVPDSGYPGLVLHATIGNTIHHGAGLTQVDAGVDWDHFVLTMCRQGIAEVASLAGIPGLTGGSPIQNIGAYGQEVATSIHAVRAYDRQTRTFVTLSHAQCAFAYRTSLFNTSARGRYVVTRVNFHFDPAAAPNLTYADLAPLRDSHPTPLEVYHFVRSIRAHKGMLIDAANPHPDSRSAGSFFKNPIVPAACLDTLAAALALDPRTIPHWPQPAGDLKLAAAWLIGQAGFQKGFALPGADAAISSRHTLALVNRTGHATCDNLLALRDHIVHTVQSKFAITLEQEPILLA